MGTTCNMKSCLLSVIAVTVFLLVYGYVIHEIFLKADYMATKRLWRSAKAMEELAIWGVLFNIAIAMVFTCMFKKFQMGYAACKGQSGDQKCPVKSGGLCYGIGLGLLLGLLMAQSYIWMPIPVDLAVKWFFTGLFEGIGVGVILGMLYKPNAGSCNLDTGKTTENN